MIRVIHEDPEERKKVDVPDWLPDVDDDVIGAAIAKAKQMPATLADPNLVQVPWGVLVMPVTAAALDFGNVSQIKVKLGALIASQTWIQLDRLIAHIQQPGKRQDNDSPFTSLAAMTTEGGVIIDGHHSLTALWLLAGSDLEVPVWFVPIGLATGHPR